MLLFCRLPVFLQPGGLAAVSWSVYVNPYVTCTWSILRASLLGPWYPHPVATNRTVVIAAIQAEEKCDLSRPTQHNPTTSTEYRIIQMHSGANRECCKWGNCRLFERIGALVYLGRLLGLWTLWTASPQWKWPWFGVVMAAFPVYLNVFDLFFGIQWTRPKVTWRYLKRMCCPGRHSQVHTSNIVIQTQPIDANRTCFDRQHGCRT